MISILAAPRRRVALAAAGLSALVLVASVQLGLAGNGRGLLDGFASSGRPSADRIPGDIAPLSGAFVERVLGVAFGDDAATVDITDTHPGPGARTPRPAIEPFTNDRFADATVISSLPYATRTDTRRATSERGEPTSCAPVGGTVWYRYSAPDATSLVADTFGSSYATALAVFSGTSLSSLRSVGCNRGPTGNARVGFVAAAATTYWFQVTGPAGGGQLTFALTPTGRTSIMSVRPDGTQADGDAFEPPHVSADGRNIVFYSRASNLNDACRSSMCGAEIVRDRATGALDTVASVDLETQSNVSSGGSYVDGPDLFDPALSLDGRFVAFNTDAALSGDDANGDDDVYLVDRTTRQVERVSLTSSGGESHAPIDEQRAPINPSANNYPGSKFASLSADASVVVFTSNATDLIQGRPGTGKNQVYVRDRRAGTTTLVSVGPDGAPLGAAEARLGQDVSANGRYVVFSGWRRSPTPPVGRAPVADELAQVYLHDRATGATTLISRGRNGAGDADSYFPAISADGSHVAFASEADDLVAGDHNGEECARSGYDTCGVDFFSYDVASGRLVRVSVNSRGTEQDAAGNLGGTLPDLCVSVSSDGRFVAFPSLATNLGPDQGNGKRQIYVHDLSTGSTIRASVSSAGAAANDDAILPVLAPDGSFVTFISSATNLATDRNGFADVFLHELVW